MPTFRIAAIVTLAALAACNSEPEFGERRRINAPREQVAAEPAEQSKRAQRRFDGEGRLLPSDDYVAGVRLPRGSELYYQSGLQHVYRIQAPIDRVLAYIGPMMITGKVERRGKGALYKRASVRGAEVNPTKVDVSILEIGNNLTRISVTEIPPPPAHIPSSDQTKSAARDNWRTLD